MKSFETCYLTTGHDGHDLLAPGQKCTACDFVAPSTSVSLAAIHVTDRLDEVAGFFDTKPDDKAMLAHLNMARKMVQCGYYNIADASMATLERWFVDKSDADFDGERLRPNAEMRAGEDLRQARLQLARIIKAGA